jgi:hypothetical protein
VSFRGSIVLFEASTTARVTSMEVLVLGPDVFVLLAAIIFGFVFLVRGLTKRPLRIRVEEIWIYPLKSCRGIKVDSAKLDSQTGERTPLDRASLGRRRPTRGPGRNH